MIHNAELLSVQAAKWLADSWATGNDCGLLKVAPSVGMSPRAYGLRNVMCLGGHVLSWEEELHSDLHQPTLSRNSLESFDRGARLDAFIAEPDLAGSQVWAGAIPGARCEVTGRRGA